MDKQTNEATPSPKGEGRGEVVPGLPLGPGDQPTKGAKLCATNCMGIMQECEYEHKVIRQDDCHSVLITTGDYKGVCYKGISELYQPSKTELNGNP